jgi:hypothetical protein
MRKLIKKTIQEVIVESDQRNQFSEDILKMAAVACSYHPAFLFEMCLEIVEMNSSSTLGCIRLIEFASINDTDRVAYFLKIICSNPNLKSICVDHLSRYPVVNNF